MTAKTMLASRFQMDVSPDASTWTPVRGTVTFVPKITQRRMKRTVYSGGWGGEVPYGIDSWTLTIEYLSQITGTTRDAGQAAIEALADAVTGNARTYVRWYDRHAGINDGAKQGRAIVDLTRTGTGSPDLERIQVVFTGDGALTDISNPL